jgi:hypothetical protein
MITATADHLITLGLVGVALLYAARRAWRAYSASRGQRGSGCGPGCGCD